MQAKTLAPKAVDCEISHHRLKKETSISEDVGPEGVDCVKFQIDWRGEQVPAKMLVLEEVDCDIGWRGNECWAQKEGGL